MSFQRVPANESGAALLLALFALVLLSLLGLFMCLNATTAVQISDNYESQLQATYAALAGLSHARAALRGLALNDLLKGPDGIYDSSASYISKAKGFEYRNAVPLLTALTLNLVDPSSDVAGIPDDGFISTGSCDGIRGIDIIPGIGIMQSAPNPYGSGTIPVSRYFVKVSDNNGEASEIAGDPANNPFIDGDGIVIVRSLGVARTMPDAAGLNLQRNSIATFEARYRRRSTWILGPALVVLGPQADAGFSGTFEISGGASPGIGTIDTVPGDNLFPDLAIRAAAGDGSGITGGGEPSPSIRDVTGQIRSDQDKRLLLDPSYVWNFINIEVPRMADNLYEGNQSWLAGSAPDLGTYDTFSAWNAPGQDPKITLVHGDLQINGNVSGGGLLVVTGSFSYSGSFAFNGLVIVAGSGRLTASGFGIGVEGGVLVANLTDTGGGAAFGSSVISVGESSRIVSNKANVQMAISLIPVSQISFREIAGSDP